MNQTSVSNSRLSSIIIIILLYMEYILIIANTPSLLIENNIDYNNLYLFLFVKTIIFATILFFNEIKRYIFIIFLLILTINISIIIESDNSIIYLSTLLTNVIFIIYIFNKIIYKITMSIAFTIITLLLRILYYNFFIFNTNGSILFLFGIYKVIGIIIFIISTMAFILFYHKENKKIIFVLVPIHILFLLFFIDSNIIKSCYNNLYPIWYINPAKISFIFKVLYYILLCCSAINICKLFYVYTQKENNKILSVYTLFLLLLLTDYHIIFFVAIFQIINKYTKNIIFIYAMSFIIFLYMLFFTIEKIYQFDGMLNIDTELYLSSIAATIKYSPLIIPVIFLIILTLFIINQRRKDVLL